MPGRDAFHYRKRAPRPCDKGRHRVHNKTWKPEETYRNGSILLGLCAGLTAHAIHEAWEAADTWWMVLFSVFLLVNTALYLQTCWLWIVGTGRGMRL